ncbi:hypothetical protein [Streptomyces sp. NPDC056244]|uniref:hypothetical protein n=1 Tax=Streptomyces sp. NPDC056244 TaxID=3345762 RepID=UPI0035DAE8AE
MTFTSVLLRENGCAEWTVEKPAARRPDTVVGGWERFTFQHADNFTVTGKEPAAPTRRPLG